MGCGSWLLASSADGKKAQGIQGMKMTHTPAKKILAIHDLSSFGHTSLMVFIAILYRMGLRVCALPTAVLSANTDFPDSIWVDLGEHLENFAQHWQELGLEFSAICSGFLASEKQAELVSNLTQKLRGPQTIVLTDPVMGDNGRLYDCFGPEMVEAMRGLIRHAQIVTPNHTEAALLTGEDPNLELGREGILERCRKIAGMGPEHVVITSVPTKVPNRLVTMYYHAGEDSMQSHFFTARPGHHPGAGDCFSALLLGGLMKGYGVENSVGAGVEILSGLISRDPLPGADWREGIALEVLMQMDLEAFYRKSR